MRIPAPARTHAKPQFPARHLRISSTETDPASIVPQKTLKSRSHVGKVSNPWAGRIAATRASWTTLPCTRGRRAIRSKTSNHPSGSCSSRTVRDAIQAESCHQDASRSIEFRPQILGLVPTLMNSAQTGQVIAQGVCPSSRPRNGPGRRGDGAIPGGARKQDRSCQPHSPRFVVPVNEVPQLRPGVVLEW